MANLLVLLVEVAVILFAFVHLVVPEAIMCSRCHSKDDEEKGDCQNNPPEPTRCPVTSNTQQFCMTMQEFQKDGTRLAFIRDCSTTKMVSECKVLEDTKSPHKICYETCDKDGCNSASSTTRASTISTMVFACLGSQLLRFLRR